MFIVTIGAEGNDKIQFAYADLWRKYRDSIRRYRVSMCRSIPRLRNREWLSDDYPSSYFSHTRKLRLSCERHNLMVSLIYVSPLFFLVSTNWQHFVFSQEQRYNHIDQQCLDGLLETEDHRTQLARTKGRAL